MAIQNRRGVYTDFDASKMVAGEFAVVQSGDPDSPNGVSLYVAFQSGTVKRIALIDDVNETVGSLEDLETTAKTSIVDSINELAEKASIYHGVTSTSGATRDKVVVCSDFELKDGVYIAVDFSQNNTATNARLNVNNTGAKSIVASGNSYVTDWIVSGSTYLFRFEDNALGGAYYLIGATERIPSDSAPIMDGTATSGTSKQYARADHVHPTDTSRASTATATTAANGLMSSTDKSKLDGIEAQANKTTIDATLANTGQAADAKKVGDELSAVKEDLQEITEETTIEDFDTDNNLVEGLTLSSGYYSTDALIDNANFSHVVVDVTGLSKVKIYGTHHIYTTSQFNQLGGFWDSNDNYITGIVNQYGSLPTLPYEVNVPTNATKLIINTDYKASDFPSSLPSGLAVYPWAILTGELKVPYSALEKPPVALADLSDGSKKLKILAGVIRNSGNGWEYIDDSGHNPLNLTSVSVDANGKLEIDYGFTASKVLSLVATPDETFAGLYSIGGSVGLDKTLFNCYALPKVYGGMVRITNGVVDATSYASFTSAEIKTNGEIRLYHPTLSGMSSKEVFNIQASSPYYAIKLGSQGFDYVSLYAYDVNGQKITDFTGLSIDIYATRTVNARFVNANDIVDAGGNFWIYGVMEI